MDINGQTSIDDFLGELMAQQPKHEKQEKKKTRKPATSAITKATRQESHESTNKQPLEQLVLDTLLGRELTAREVAAEMYARGLLPYPERAIIQPRITELVVAGKIIATGKKLDTVTSRKVAVYKVV